mmetsp:Transcript_91388/g.255279  ORF Transcript_91388/g.255279 Transcript_91388/m.255279 type:complete len:316 (-) Transcript_91388:25-972(-)
MLLLLLVVRGHVLLWRHLESGLPRRHRLAAAHRKRGLLLERVRRALRYAWRRRAGHRCRRLPGGGAGRWRCRHRLGKHDPVRLLEEDVEGLDDVVAGQWRLLLLLVAPSHEEVRDDLALRGLVRVPPDLHRDIADLHLGRRLPVAAVLALDVRHDGLPHGVGVQRDHGAAHAAVLAHLAVRALGVDGLLRHILGASLRPLLRRHGWRGLALRHLRLDLLGRPGAGVLLAALAGPLALVLPALALAAGLPRGALALALGPLAALAHLLLLHDLGVLGPAARLGVRRPLRVPAGDRGVRRVAHGHPLHRGGGGLARG